MEKFGLDSLQSQKITALDLELIKEKASALGVAGTKLQKALDRYRFESERDWRSTNQDQVLEQIRNAFSELLIQRELAGLVHENVQWIASTYAVPANVLRKLGY